MACCERHDRLDLKLASSEYLDFVCGSPSNPDGERRYCCKRCPAQGTPLTPKMEWAGSPLLLSHLPPDVAAACLQLAADAGVDYYG